jgi:hypothetical protein
MERLAPASERLSLDSEGGVLRLRYIHGQQPATSRHRERMQPQV